EAVGDLARADDVHRQAALQAFVRDGAAELVGGRPGVPVGDELETDEQAAATHVADLLVRALQFAEACGQVLAGGRGRPNEPPLLDHVQNGQTRGGRQRIRDVRRDVEEA